VVWSSHVIRRKTRCTIRKYIYLLWLLLLLLLLLLRLLFGEMMCRPMKCDRLFYLYQGEASAPWFHCIMKSARSLTATRNRALHLNRSCHMEKTLCMILLQLLLTKGMLTITHKFTFVVWNTLYIMEHFRILHTDCGMPYLTIKNKQLTNFIQVKSQGASIYKL